MTLTEERDLVIVTTIGRHTENELRRSSFSKVEALQTNTPLLKTLPGLPCILDLNPDTCPISAVKPVGIPIVSSYPQNRRTLFFLFSFIRLVYDVNVTALLSVMKKQLLLK